MTVYYSMNIWLHSMVSMSSRGHEYHRTSLAFVWDTYSTKPMINWKLIGWRWRVAGSHAYFCSLRYYSAKRWLSSPIGGWMLQWALLITPFGRWYCSGLYWHRSHNTEVTQAPFHSSHSHSQFRAFALNIWFIDFVTSGIIGRFVGSKSLLPLSKITNCVLLIYPLVSRVIILSSDGTFHLSVGLIVSIAINSPCSRLQCEGLIRMFCTIFCFFIADDNVFWHVGHCLFDRICAVHDLWGTIWPAIATDLQSTLKLNSQSPLLQQWIVKFNSIIIVPTSWLYICNNIRIIKFYTRILDKKFKLCASLDVRCSSLHNGRKERSKQKKIHRRDFDPRQHKNHIKRS